MVLGARRVYRVQALAAELGESALAVRLDVSDETSVIAAFDAAEAGFGTVESIVCNAGLDTGGRSTDVTSDDMRAVLDTNLAGAYLVARDGARRLIASGSRDRESVV